MNDNQKLMYIFIILFCLAIGLYLIIPKVNESYTTYKQIQEKQVKVQKTQTQIDELRAQKLAYEKQEKSATKPVYKTDVASLDPMASFGIMFEDVIQAAKYNGLKLRSIEYAQNPPDDIVSQNVQSDFNVCAVKMQLIGSYAQFRSYFDDIANYILSCHGNQTEHISKDYQAFKNFLDRKLSLHPRFYITKDAGMFICQK